MPRYRLLLEYDGAPFVGWQRQDNGPSVQEALEEAVFRFAGERIAAVAAGRTDAGVHARAMCVHVDLAKAWPADVVRDALNHHLKPAPVAALEAALAPDGFHARFSATARAYEYRIVARRAPLALEAGRAWRLPGALDAAAMNAAARRLVGRHDFTTFRAAACQAASPVKTLSEIAVSADGDRIRIFVRAPSFLHHQVRSIAGSLVEVGMGRWDADALADALNARDRSRCGQVAPPHGLYFLWAEYGEGSGRNGGADRADQGGDCNADEDQPE
ncbi:MAG: tRNA pseudouridine(38-40) synthase TruA [Alphaproteobacteria bacterium]|nr:tRNA pseudouridine(38-40) synthase TruA [Alphaproteobacteria bacterium]